MDAVTVRVLEIVAEQTGYPPDMLELDLDLEADLGIDTVKQAEMFAAIRAAYGIERDENLALRDYPTLARAIEFVYEKRPELRPRGRRGCRSGRGGRGGAGRGGGSGGRRGGRRGGSGRGARHGVGERTLGASSRIRWRSGCWRSWRSRRAIRPTCWSWTWTWRPISGSTR